MKPNKVVNYARHNTINEAWFRKLTKLAPSVMGKSQIESLVANPNLFHKKRSFHSNLKSNRKSFGSNLKSLASNLESNLKSRKCVI